MSKIDDLMKQLEEKKITIEAYNLIADSLGDTLKDTKFDNIREDVSGKIAEYIIAEIEAVEQSAGLGASQPQEENATLSGFSQEDVGLLRNILDRAKGKTPQNNGAFSEGGNPPPQQPRQRRPVNAAAPDKIKFALANRHLEGKTVVFQGNSGLIEGTVRGLDAPNVVIQTDTGKTHEVPIDAIEVKGA